VPSIVNTKAETQDQRALAMLDFKRVGRIIRADCPKWTVIASTERQLWRATR
jgi:hypothetical protein